MNKSIVILGSILGGAIVGSAVTMMCCPKSGAEMRRDAHKMLSEQLNHIHEHIKKCSCMMSGDCDTEQKAEM